MDIRRPAVAALALCLSAPALATFGVPDPTFATAGVFRSAARGAYESVAITPAGEITFARAESSCVVQPTTSCFLFGRIAATGQPDALVGPNGERSVPVTNVFFGIGTVFFSDVRAHPDGTTLVHGVLTELRGRHPSLTKVRPDGTIDPAWGWGTFEGSSPKVSPAVYPDGRFVMNGGAVFTATNKLFRRLPDATQDPTWTPFEAYGLPLRLDLMTPMPDGGLVIPGSAGSNQVTRLGPDGLPLASFGTNGVAEVPGLTDEFVQSVAVQPDGKVLLAGYTGEAFTPAGCVPRQQLTVVRLTTGGLLDPTFGIGGRIMLPLRHGAICSSRERNLTARVAVAPDGRFIVGDTDDSVLRRIFLARLGTDGFLRDTAYVDPTPGEDILASLQVAPDGRIVLTAQVDRERVDPPSPSGFHAVLRVLNDDNPLGIGPSPLKRAGVLSPYSQPLRAAGGTPPYTYTIAAGTLPAGLSLVGDAIEGVPQVPGSARLVLKVTDAQGAFAYDHTSIEVHTPASLVTDFYGSILGRAADAQGQQFWTSEVARLSALGASPVEVFQAMALAFFGSPEYGTFVRDGGAFVGDLYRTFLGREPDGEGVSFWTNQLNNGKSRDAILNDFLFTPEFGQAMATVFGGASASRAEVAMIVNFYRGLLRRLPDSGGFTGWLGAFRAAQCNGTVATQVDSISRQFIESAEYANRLAALPEGDRARTYVTDLYNAILRRGGDVEGLGYWTQALVFGRMTREELRRQFLASAEFQALVAAVAAEPCQ